MFCPNFSLHVYTVYACLEKSGLNYLTTNHALAPSPPVQVFIKLDVDAPLLTNPTPCNSTTDTDNQPISHGQPIFTEST